MADREKGKVRLDDGALRNSHFIELPHSSARNVRFRLYAVISALATVFLIVLAECTHRPLFLAHQILKLAVVMKKLVAYTFGIQDTALTPHCLVDFIQD
jgi:hypothetical protein